MSIVSRLLTIARTRSRREMVGFILTRLVRVQTHSVFFADRVELATDVKWKSNESVVDAAGPDDIDALLARTPNLPEGIHEYLNAVRDGDAVGVFIFVDNRLAHWAFLMRGSRTLCYLGFSCRTAVLLGAAHTLPEFRGQGLQTRSVSHRIAIARKYGYHVVVSETAPANEYSARALKSGGMTRQGHLRVLIVCNHFVIRRHVIGEKKTMGFRYCK